MAASAGTVTLELDANSVKLLRELQKSQRATQRSATRMERSMSRAFLGIRRAALSAGAALTAAFSVQTLREVAQAGIEMERLERGLRVASGSAEGAKEEMAFLRAEANRLGLDLRTAGQGFTSLAAAAKGTALEGQASRDIFTAVSEASRVMGLSVDQTSGALTAIEQIISKGKVSAEELRGQLGERLPGAFQIAARSIGVTTAELDDMLKKGQLTAEDLLPALAKELRKTFGPEVESAANDAQAAFARFQTAIFDLKASIAQSGVLDAMAALAKGMQQIIAPTVADEMHKIRSQIESMEQSFREAGGIGPAPGLKHLRLQLADLALGLSRTGEAYEVLVGVTTTATKRETDYAEALAKVNKQYQTAEQRVDALRAILRRFGDDLRPETIALIMNEIQEEWSGGLEEIVIDTKRRFSEPVKKEFDQMQEFAKQAASNIQDAFADFLFDPFADGLEGMVKGFLDAIRRILANQAALQFFKWIQTSFGGEKLTGIDMASLPKARAMGGSVASGTPYMVGERGPELFVPGASGTIIPNNKLGSGGGVSVVNNIDARGSDPSFITRLPAILEQNRRQTIAEIMQLQATRRAIE